MVTPTRQNRFQSFTPLRASTHSLRRLKTAFSPTRSLRSTSPSSSTGTTSPLTRTASPDSHHSHRSVSSNHSIRQILAVRRKPSVLDLEIEEEKHLFSHELEMLEPRPSVGHSVEVGIFEVLDGKF